MRACSAVAFLTLLATLSTAALGDPAATQPTNDRTAEVTWDPQGSSAICKVSVPTRLANGIASIAADGPSGDAVRDLGTSTWPTLILTFVRDPARFDELMDGITDLSAPERATGGAITDEARIEIVEEAGEKVRNHVVTIRPIGKGGTVTDPLERVYRFTRTCRSDREPNGLDLEFHVDVTVVIHVVGGKPYVMTEWGRLFVQHPLGSDLDESKQEVAHVGRQ